MRAALPCRHMLSLSMALTLASVAPAADWPQWRGPQRDGTTAERIATNWPASGPRVLWRAEVGKGHAPVTIAADRAITLGYTGQNDRVWCFEAATGRVLWQFDYAAIASCPGEPGNGAFVGPHAAPAIVGGRVYTLSRDGQVHCLDLTDGKCRWARDLHANGRAKLPECGFSGAPLVRDGVVYVNVGEWGAALDADTGAIRWQSGPAMAGYAAPVLVPMGSGGPQLAVFGARALFCVNPGDGQTNWSLAWPTAYGVNAVDPIVVDDGLFITSAYSRGCALVDLRTGAARWRNKNLGSQCSPPVLRNGNLYGFDGFIDWPRNQNFACLDPRTGTVRWRKDKMAGQVILAGDRLVMTLVSGDIAVAPAEPDAYRELARARLFSPEKCTVPAALANGRL